LRCCVIEAVSPDLDNRAGRQIVKSGLKLRPPVADAEASRSIRPLGAEIDEKDDRCEDNETMPSIESRSTKDVVATSQLTRHEPG
jgi:hypothetical protein